MGREEIKKKATRESVGEKKKSGVRESGKKVYRTLGGWDRKAP